MLEFYFHNASPQHCQLESLVNIHPSGQTNDLSLVPSPSAEMLATDRVVTAGVLVWESRMGKSSSRILHMTMELSYTLACKYLPTNSGPCGMCLTLPLPLLLHVLLAVRSVSRPHGLLLSFLKNSAFTNSFQNPIQPFIAAIVFNTRT